MAEEALQDELSPDQYHRPIYFPWLHIVPAQPSGEPSLIRRVMLTAPVGAPILLPNSSSEVRDLLATERTLLSNLRLATYLAVVSAAIIVSFHLKNQPTETEKQVSFPLGLVFGVMSLICLGMGIGNYARTVEGYAKQRALVQSGWKTQVILGVLGVVVVGTCLFFIGVGANARG